MFTDKEYADEGGNVCPFCQSENITAMGQGDSDAGYTTVKIGCNSCHKYWHELYKLVGYTCTAKVKMEAEEAAADDKMEFPPSLLRVYACEKCGCETTQATNHTGPTWSVGHFNTCPKCPPHAKYPEYGGVTVWKYVRDVHNTDKEE